jgi:cell division protein ZapA (FtsZ GTPase activity inhibitor)
MDETQKYELNVLGQKFILTTIDGQANELKKVAEYYRSIVEYITQKLPNRSQLDIAVLAGLKITDKLYTAMKSKNMDLDSVNDKLHEIVNEAIKRLDISMEL